MNRPDSADDGDGAPEGPPPAPTPGTDERADAGAADTVGAVGADVDQDRHRRRRRWAVIAVAGVTVVAVALSPLSPLSPFGSGDGDEQARAPQPDARAGPTTTQLDHFPRPGPTMVPPTSLVPSTTTTAPPPAPTTPPVPAPAPIRDLGYRLDFTDDFQGGGPDPAVWATAPFGESLPPTVADGHLTIETTAANEHKWGYVASTGPRADGEPNYADPRAWETGYFEARLRYTDDRWSWPAFWLFSMAKTEAWPREDCSELNAEWDIMENGIQNSRGERPAGSWYFTALHRNTSDNTSDGYCATADEQRQFGQDFGDTDLATWHTWGAHWTSDRLCTYLDGVEIHCTEHYDSTSQPMHLVFTIQYLRQCDGCPPRPPELELQVDWVRVWRAP